MEYLPGQDLLGFLQKSRGHEHTFYQDESYPLSALTEKHLLSFAWMTADGMAFLAEKQVYGDVHCLY